MVRPRSDVRNVVFALIVYHLKSSQEESVETSDFYTYFVEGVTAYNYHSWELCRESMVNSLTAYRRWEQIVSDCRKKCHSIDLTSQSLVLEKDFSFFERTFKTTSCVSSCKSMGFKAGEIPDLSKVDMDKFDSLEPYNYLQICAYKTGNIEQAVASAYTYFLQNPDHEVMKQNLIDYRNLPQVSDIFFKDIERPVHQSLYIHGLKAYHEGVWLHVIDYMSRAVHSFLMDLEKCENVCEEKYSVVSEAYTSRTVSDIYADVLKCKLHCDVKLSRYHDKTIDNMLADFHHYLQFAYYQVKDVQKACQCVANYMLLRPDDAVMKSNQAFYVREAGAKEEDFTPSESIVKYFNHRQQITKLLEVHDQSLSSSPVDVIPSPELFPYKPAQVTDNDRDVSSVIEEYKARGITVTYTEVDLNGPQRVVADGVATQDTCDSLIKLANVAAQKGDGYRHGKISSPHTKHEMFEGMTIARGVQLVMNSAISPDIVQKYLDATRVSREFTQRYFGLDSLYFDFTHLVCRTSLDKETLREDLSHPIHADNCIIQKDGSCKRDYPAYVERDFSALLYLNDNFEGGDFFFAHKNLSTSATVRPKCGRLVAFNATNYHGVKAVLDGQRCAVAMWYTLDKKFQELSHIQAQSYLDALQKETEEKSSGEDGQSKRSTESNTLNKFSEDNQVQRSTEAKTEKKPSGEDGHDQAPVEDSWGTRSTLKEEL